MATDNPDITYNGDHSVYWYTYAGLDNGDDGAPIYCDTHQPVSVQVIGTPGSGGVISFEGSNVAAAGTTDANYFILTDPAGNALTYTNAVGGDAVDSDVKWIRPHVTAGDGSTDLTAIIMMVKRWPKAV